MAFTEIMTHPLTGIFFGALTIYWARHEKKWKSAKMILGGGVIGIAVYRIVERDKCKANRVRSFSIDASTGRPCDDRSVHCL